MEYIEILFALLGLASTVARITPNTSDNRWMDAAWKFVNALGLRGGPTK
jgi:hypothetical protein